MPYLGNPVVDRFTSTKAASVYSGDGSTVAFTLEHSVGSDEDILVSVDGVIQEPSVAYAVSNGTTLTFTAAPSTNAGNNIFVYYLFTTIGTVTHPPTSALSATSGTFSTTLGVTGNTTVGGTFGVTGNTTVGGTLGVTGAVTASGDMNFNSGFGSAAIAYGCRAWVNFNGTGTVAIRASGNVSSITDNGTGTYVVNLTTAMPDTNYAVVLGSGGSTGGSAFTRAVTGKTTSAFEYNSYNANTGQYVDIDTNNAAVLRQEKPMNRILFKNDDGGVSVIVPSPNCELTIEEIAAKDVPTGLKYKIVDVSEVPSDRTFRNAWTIDDSELTDGVGA